MKGFSCRKRRSHPFRRYRFHPHRSHSSVNASGRVAALEARNRVLEEQLQSCQIQLAEMQVAASQSSAQLDEILQNALVAICQSRVFGDRSWQHDYFSLGFEQMLGYSATELLEDPMLWQSRVHPEDLSRLLDIVYDAIFAESSIAYEYRFYHRDGSLRWIATTLNSRYNPMGDCWIVTTVGTDITDRKATAAALAQQESQFRALVDHLPFEVWAKDRQGRSIIQNPLNRCRWGDLLGRSVDDFFGVEEDRKQVWQAENHQVFSGQILHKEEAFWIEGNQRIYDKILVPLWEGDQVVGMLGVYIDISDRKRLESELRESREQLRQILENIQDVFFLKSVQTGELLYVNQRYEQIHQHSVQSISDSPHDWLNHIHPEDRDRVRSKFQQELRGETFFDDEYRILLPDGSVRWIWNRSFPIYNEAGEIYRYAGIERDITERKATETALQQLNQLLEQRVQWRTEQLQLALSAAQMGTWEWDLATGREWWSPETFALMGLQPHPDGVWNQLGVKVASHPTFELFLSRIHPEDRELLQIAHQRALAERSPYECEFRLVWDDGSIHWCAAKGAYLYDGSGRPLKLTGFSQDTTQRQQAEAQLRASLREKEVLLQEIHHRVKNNLQMVSSLLNLQAGTLQDETVRELFAESQSRIKAIALIHEHLYRSSDLSQIDFAQYVSDLSNDLGRSQLLRRTAIQLQADVEPTQLSLDAAIPCGLIINELVSNAIKYAFPEQQAGTVRICFRAQPQEYFVLTVQDNGIGFPDSLDLDHTDSLGLQLVGALVHQLRGRLELRRSPGTTFTLCFPRPF